MALLLMLTLLSAADVNAEIESVWKQVRPSTAWSWRLTPAVPKQWPPTSNDAVVVRYAYAASFDPALHDGERTSPPFAMIEIAADGKTTVTSLGTKLGAGEVQGVSPITKDEAERLQGDLIEPARKGQMSSMRAAWCHWLKYNGVVGRQLATRHASFFEALDCRSVKGAK